MTPQRCDVAVVGSGPAGASCAQRLAESGIDTLLIEQKRFPRIKACGEYLNAVAVERLVDLGVDVRLRRSATQLRGMRLFAHGEEGAFPFDRELWSIPRSMLDDALRQNAVRRGARTLAGRVIRVENDHDGVRLHMRDENGGASVVTAKYAVGADGLHSTIAHAPRRRTKPTRERFAIGGHYGAGASLDGWIEMYRVREGYLALNPLPLGEMNAMCVISAHELYRWRKDVDRGMRDFSVDASAGCRVLEPAMRSGERVSIGPLTPVERAAMRGRVLLAGDAAAFLDPFTGQGVSFALISGQLAARASIETLAVRGEAPLIAYAAAVSRMTRERRQMTRLVDAILQQGFIVRLAARRLRESPRLTHALVDLVAGGGTDREALEMLARLPEAVSQ